MTDNPKTFDLLGALQGRTFPEIIVPVFFDEELQFELSRIDREIIKAIEPEVLAELEKHRESLLEKFKEAVIKVRVKGVPRHVREATLEKILEDHPQEFTAFGTPKPNREGDKALTAATWALHVIEIIGPDGSSLLPTVEDLNAFRAQAPDSAIDAVTGAIHELSDGSKSGYEKAVQDLDFLSQP